MKIKCDTEVIKTSIKTIKYRTLKASK